MAQYFAVLDRRDQTMKRCEALLDDHDAWLMPVMPTPPSFARSRASRW
jgi:amidase